MSQYIEKIYSKITPELLLHQVIRYSIFKEDKRNDVVRDDRFLQLASLTVKEGQTFKPHRHIYKWFNSNNFIANEAWIIISGCILAQYYDVEGDNIIAEKYLYQGDVTMTFENGGHNYKGISPNSLVYEFKSGPYRGIEWDKVQI